MKNKFREKLEKEIREAELISKIKKEYEEFERKKRVKRCLEEK
jgi:hypothetical protein